MVSDRSKGILFTLAATICGTPTGLLVRLLSHNGSWILLMFRSVPYLVALVLFMLIQYGATRTIAAMGRLSLSMNVAGLFLAIQSIAIVWACMLTTVANVFFILQLAPLISAIVDSVFLGEPVPLRTRVLIAAGLVSMVIIFVGNLGSGGTSGDLIALLNPVSWSIYWMILRKRAKAAAAAAGAEMTVNGEELAGAEVAARLTAACDVVEDKEDSGVDEADDLGLLPLFFVCQLTCLLVGLVVVAASNDFGRIEERGQPLDPVWYLLFGGCVLPMTQYLFSVGPRYISTAEVASIKMAETVFAPLWVFLVFGEVPSVATFVGGSLLVFAICVHSIVTVRANQGPKEECEPANMDGKALEDQGAKI